MRDSNQSIYEQEEHAKKHDQGMRHCWWQLLDDMKLLTVEYMVESIILENGLV